MLYCCRCIVGVNIHAKGVIAASFANSLRNRDSRIREEFSLNNIETVFHFIIKLVQNGINSEISAAIANLGTLKENFCRCWCVIF